MGDSRAIYGAVCIGNNRAVYRVVYRVIRKAIYKAIVEPL